jgi:hypothetical protein
MIAWRRSAARIARVEAGFDAEDLTTAALETAPFEAAVFPPGRRLADRTRFFFAGFVPSSVMDVL